MTPQELFDRLTDWNQKTISRCEVMKCIETITENCREDLCLALLYDLEQCLIDWKWDETEAILTRKYEFEYYEWVRKMEKLGIPEFYWDEECFNKPKLKWPVEREEYDMTIENPEMYDFVIETLKSKIPSSKTTHTFTLPEELDTERARHYITEAITRGFIKQTTTGLEWIGPTQQGVGKNTLIALFFGVIYCEDEIIPSRYGDKWKLGSGLFPDEALKRLFGLKSLGAIRTNNLNSDREKNVPRGWKDIIEIFD